MYYLTLPNGNLFGYYAFIPNNPQFMYHFDMGYEYIINANDGKNGIYLYDFASGHWWYTSPTYAFPYMYDFTLNAVVYYYADANNAGHYTTNPRYFYNFGAQAITTIPSPSQNAVVTVGTSAVSQAFSAVNGYGVSVSLPPTSDGSSHRVSITVSSDPPVGFSGMRQVPSIGAVTPLFYVAVSALDITPTKFVYSLNDITLTITPPLAPTPLIAYQGATALTGYPGWAYVLGPAIQTSPASVTLDSDHHLGYGFPGSPSARAYGIFATTAVPIAPTTAGQLAYMGCISAVCALGTGAALSPTPSVLLEAGISASAITFDPSGDRYYYGLNVIGVPGIVPSPTYEILQYPAGYVGAPPRRVIGGPKTLLDGVGGIFIIDSAGDVIMNRNEGGLLIFSPAASGNVAPDKLLLGPSDPTNIFTGAKPELSAHADTSGHLFVLYPGKMIEYNVGTWSVVATADTSTWDGWYTGYADISSIGSGSTVYAASGTALLGSLNPPRISVYRQTSLLTAPTLIATITGPLTTMTVPYRAVSDAAGNIYVADGGVFYTQPYNQSYPYRILEFAPGSNGNVAPVAIINGDKINIPSGISALVIH